MPVPTEPAVTTPAGDAEFPFVKVVEYVKRVLAEGRPEIYRTLIHEIDRHVLRLVMDHFRGNQFQAAERLGISRMTLRTKLRALGMIPARRSERRSPQFSGELNGQPPDHAASDQPSSDQP